MGKPENSKNVQEQGLMEFLEKQRTKYTSSLREIPGVGKNIA